MNPNFDKQEMRSYLLGILDADRSEAVEESILCEQEVYDELLVIEEDLIDQYMAGSLSPLEKRRFETHFLITAERQKNLRLGRLLKRYANSHSARASAETVAGAVRPAQEPAPAKVFLPFLVGSASKGPALAFSAALIACLGVIVLLCWLAARKPLHRTGSVDSDALVVTLMPGSLRTMGATTERVTVPPKGHNVKLRLELSDKSFQNYRSELFRENESMQTINELKVETQGEQHFVPFTIPGELLSPGDYQVKLSGVLDSGQDEFIDNYSFRVIE